MGRKRLCRLCVFSYFFIFSSGCRQPQEAETPSSPFGGMTLLVACPDRRSADLVQTAAKSWVGRHGARIEVTIHEDNGPEKGDVWLIAPADLPHLAFASLVQPLPASYQARGGPFDWDGLLPLYRDSLLSWGAGEGTSLRAWALPFLGDAPVCCYRTDIFGDQPPATWEALAGVARAALPTRRLAALPLDDETLTNEFLALASNYARRAIPENEPKKADTDDQTFSFYYDLKTGKPRIDDPGFVHALKWLQLTRDCRPKEADKEPELSFLKGESIFCYTQARWVYRFQTDSASKVRNRFGICPVPGAERVFGPEDRTGHETQPANRVPYLGSAGYLGVVPTTSKQSEAAFSLLAELSGKDVSLQLVQEPRIGGGPIRQSQLSDETRWDSYELDRSKTDALRYSLRQTLLHPNMRNPVGRLRTPDQKAHMEVLGKELRLALTNNLDARETLQRVANRWRQLDESRGLAKHLAEYRQSLGLYASD